MGTTIQPSLCCHMTMTFTIQLITWWRIRVELYKSVAWREVEYRQNANLKQMVFIPSANII